MARRKVLISHTHKSVFPHSDLNERIKFRGWNLTSLAIGDQEDTGITGKGKRRGVTFTKFYIH